MTAVSSATTHTNLEQTQNPPVTGWGFQTLFSLPNVLSRDRHAVSIWYKFYEGTRPKEHMTTFLSYSGFGITSTSLTAKLPAGIIDYHRLSSQNAQPHLWSLMSNSNTIDAPNMPTPPQYFWCKQRGTLQCQMSVPPTQQHKKRTYHQFHWHHNCCLIWTSIRCM